MTRDWVASVESAEASVWAVALSAAGCMVAVSLGSAVVSLTVVSLAVVSGGVGIFSATTRLSRKAAASSPFSRRFLSPSSMAKSM